MAYDANNLSALSYANAFTHWHYKSASDTLATIMADGYFDTAAHMVRAGDKITIKASNGVWEDVVESVVTTAGSEDVAIGVQATTAAVAAASAAYPVGFVRKRYDGAEFVMLTADTNCAATDFVAIDTDGTCAPLDTDVAATILTGKPLGIAMVAMTAASTNTAWVCRRGRSISGNSATTMSAGVRLIATSTAGQVDDNAASGTTPAIYGAIQVGAVASNAAPYDLAYPFIEKDLII